MNAKLALAPVVLPLAILVACSNDNPAEPATVTEAIPATPVAPATASNPATSGPGPADAGVAASNEQNQATLATEAEAQPMPQDATAGDSQTGTAPATPVAAPAVAADGGTQPAMTMHHAAAVAAKHAAGTPAHHAVDMGAAAIQPDSSASTATRRKLGFSQLATHFSDPITIATPQAPKEGVAQPMLMARSVGISNLDNAARVYFAIKTQQGAWRNESLSPGQTGEIDCGIGDCLFWMSTGSQPAVRYNLQQQERYGIFWNSAVEAWDLGVRKRDDN